MMNRRNTLRKAAILVASLDRDAADALLDQMSAEQAELIRTAVLELGDIDDAEEESVIDEFFRIGPLLPEDQPAGVELELTSELRETPQVTPLARAERSHAPFRSLHGASGAALANRLRYERPQIVAVVMSQLPPASAAELLSSLSPGMQADVARRLVELEETDPEVLHEIEQGLSAWIDHRSGASNASTAGMKALETILAAADPMSHQMLLSNLAQHDQHLARQLSPRRERSFTFADLNEFDDLSLAKVLMHIDHTRLALALSGAGKAMLARACRVLPVARSARLRREMLTLGLPGKYDVEEARQQIADLASEMSSRGEVSMSTGHKLSLAG